MKTLSAGTPVAVSTCDMTYPTQAKELITMNIPPVAARTSSSNSSIKAMIRDSITRTNRRAVPSMIVAILAFAVMLCMTIVMQTLPTQASVSTLISVTAILTISLVTSAAGVLNLLSAFFQQRRDVDDLNWLRLLPAHVTLSDMSMTRRRQAERDKYGNTIGLIICGALAFGFISYSVQAIRMELGEVFAQSIADAFVFGALFVAAGVVCYIRVVQTKGVIKSIDATLSHTESSSSYANTNHAPTESESE